MTTHLAALGLAALLPAASPTPRPLFDRQPTVIDGVRYGAEQVFEGDYAAGPEASRFDPLGPKGQVLWLRGWTGSAGTYHIRFIGRRTAQAGHYGSGGGYRHMVLITDMIDAHPTP
jgi:hypothetical protein